MALSIGPNMSDELIGKQFRSFVESIFSYSPSVSSQSSRSNYNGSSVIENVFKQLSDQISKSSEEAFKSINKTYEKQLKDISARQKKIDELSQQIEKGYFDFDQSLKKQKQKSLSALKGAQTRSEAPIRQKQLEQERKYQKELEDLEKRRKDAVFEYEKNQWIKADVREKARLLEQRKLKIDSIIEEYKLKEKLGNALTDKEKIEYNQLKDERKTIDKKQLVVQQSVARSESRSIRYQRYNDEIKKIKQEQKAQELINQQLNRNDPTARKLRSHEISQNAKSAMKNAQEIYGLSSSGIKSNQISQTVSGVANVISGGPSGITNALDSVLGKASPIFMVMQSILKVVGSINQIVGKGIQTAVNTETSYMGSMNARLQRSAIDNENYYKEMISWTADASDEFGLAIGEWNAYVNKTRYIEKLNDLVQNGIAYNAEERALVATLSDRMVTTFDVLDQNLTRLIRLQQRDVTYAALGSEALLTEFLNAQFKDTSYLNNMYDAVSGILLDATAKMTADQASAFQYEVQKWLGSLYSVGLSEQGVQSLAQGLTYLATGDVTQLTSNQQLQYIYASAAERGGMSLADILVQGLDYETTNELLENVVTVLRDIYNESKTNVVQSAWSGITGLSIADLRSIQNIDTYLTNISESHASWADSLKETENQLQLVTDYSRTGTAMSIENFIDNALFSVGQTVLNSTMGSGPLGLWSHLGISDASQYLAYYLGNQMGGMLGTLISGAVTLPALVETIQSNLKFTRGLSDLSGSGSEALDARQKFGTLSTVLQGVEKDLIISSNVGSSYGVPGLDDFEYLYNFVDSNTRRLFESTLGIQRNQSSVTRDTYDNFIASVESLTPAIATDLPDLVEQAENAVNSAQTIANESSEDRALLEEATDVQDYLFENEKTIRVALSLIEDTALTQLITTLNDDEKSKALQTVLSILQNKVPVDLVDNDVNLLLNSIDRMKWSM